MDKLSAINNIDDRMKSIVGDDLPILTELKKYVIESGGKRVRPILHLYFSRMLGYEGDDWMDVGAVGELIHTASLLHDDVVDDGNVRRGKPSVNALHGNKVAVLAGDYLFSCAINHIATLKDSLKLVPVYTRVIRMLSVGELLQMRWETDLTLDTETYNRVIYGKTGSLFGAMVESAAILAGKDDALVQEFRKLGERVGHIFQVRDDFLDYFADEKEFGKNRYQDFERGVVTAPVIMMRDSMTDVDKSELSQLWEDQDLRKSDRGLTMMLGWIEKYEIRGRMVSELKESLGIMEKFITDHGDSDYRISILEQLGKLEKGIV